MQLFKTGKQVTQAVKNVQRLRTILGVFARHGLEDFLVRMRLQRYFPTITKSKEVESFSIPERLRMAFESLGPTFVKLGQLLSNRPDMIPENFIIEFKKLQDAVAPLPFEIIRKQVEQELGGRIEDHFTRFNPVSIASASIGQVHEATLKTGEQVVVKVQRPEIDKIIKNDISILMVLATMMEKYLPEIRIISPIQIVEEFAHMLQYETDFIIEANTTTKVRENFKDNPRVVIPQVYKKYTTHKILTLQQIHGIKITEVEQLRALDINPSELVDIGARVFFKMIIQDGLFHGDLHGGNLFALKDLQTNQAKVAMIDFGIVGRLSQKARDALSRMLLALVVEDYETLCYEYAELGAGSAGIDFEGFQREVRNSLSPYVGLSLKDVNAGLILINSTRIAMKYNIKLPTDWMMVFKALFTLEGLGRELDPNFDLLSIGQDLVKETIKDRFSIQRVTKDLIWLGRDVGALLQMAPRQVRLMFRKFNSNDFALEIKFKEVEILRRQLERGFRGLGLSILCASFFLASAISLQVHTEPLVWGRYPLPAMIFLMVGSIGFLGLIFKNWK